MNHRLVIGSISFLTAILSFDLDAQTACDDFESYSIGRLDSQSTVWNAWPPTLGVQDTEVSTLQYQSGNRSMRVHASGPNGWSDIYTDFGVRDSGLWKISYAVYVPTNGGGRLASLAFYNDNAPESSVFMHLFNFNGNTAKGKMYNVNASNLNLIQQFDITLNTWFEMSMVVDLDLLKVKYYRDSTLLFSGDWRSGDGIMQNQLEAFNIWSQNEAIGFAPDLFIDDFCIESSPWNVGMEEAQAGLKLYPQPCGHSLQLASISDLRGSYVVHDMQGRTILQGVHLGDPLRLSLDVSILNSGTYILETVLGPMVFHVK